MKNSQHQTRESVLAPHSAPRAAATTRLTERQLVALCQDANSRLLAAFLRVAAHLKRDPKPRSVWANRRRASNPLACPSIAAAIHIQRAQIDAILGGDTHAVEATALEAQAFADEFAFVLMTPYRAWTAGGVTFTSAGLGAVKAVAEAGSAIAIALVTKSPGDAEHAVQKSVAANNALEPFCAVARETVSGRTLAAVR